MKRCFTLLCFYLTTMGAFSQAGVAPPAFVLPPVVHSVPLGAYPMMRGSLPADLKNDKTLAEIAREFRKAFPKPRVVAGFGDSIDEDNILLGVDISLAIGTSVHALSPGTILTTSYEEDMGNYVVVAHGNNVFTVYGHLSGFARLHKGDNVRAQEIIGFAGITGLVTDECVHLAILKDGLYLNLIDLVSRLN